MRRQTIVDVLTKKDRKSNEEPPGKLADNLLGAIAASKDRPLGRLITALGIRGVGEVVASDLSRSFVDLDALSKASATDLMQIEGVGPNIAEAIVDWFDRPANLKVLRKLKAAGVWPKAEKDQRPKTGRFSGLTFVVTGTLPSLQSGRRAANSLRTAAGRLRTASAARQTTWSWGRTRAQNFRRQDPWESRPSTKPS